MPLIRRFFLVAALLLFAMGGIGLLLPSGWTVVESAFIEAPPEEVHLYLADLKRWRDWSGATPDADPTATWSYEGEPMKAGAVMSWYGELTGQGRLELLEANPSEGISYRLTLHERFDGSGKFEYQSRDGGTWVTWTDSGDLGSAIPVRYYLLFIKKEMQQNFANKLADLKNLIEGGDKVEAPKKDPDEDLLMPPPRD